MSDIVERLRALVILDEVGSNNPLGREAADEIERLERLLKMKVTPGYELLATTIEEKDAEVDRLRAALEPFMRYYDAMRFNLRKQPRPDDPAVEERGERVASITWAEFYALRDAMSKVA